MKALVRGFLPTMLLCYYNTSSSIRNFNHLGSIKCRLCEPNAKITISKHYIFVESTNRVFSLEEMNLTL